MAGIAVANGAEGGGYLLPGRCSAGPSPVAAPAAGNLPNLEIGRMNGRILLGKDTGALTRGYVKKLKIAVPEKPGFKAFVNATAHEVSGYCIDIFEAAAKYLPHALHYEFVVVDGSSYDQIVRNVSLGIYDAVVGDITITPERAVDVEFTMPFTESGVSLLVLNKNDSEPTIEWVFLKALTMELWLALVGGFFFTGLVVWIIEWPRNPEYQGSSLRQCSTALYFSFSTLTFSHGQIIRSPLSKIVVVIWCFVVLVIVQSYTASLSSILTAKRLRPYVTDLDQLRSNGDYIGYQSGSFVHSVLKNQGFNVNRLIAYKNKVEYAKALRKGSKNGGVSAIVDEIPYITWFLSDPKYHNEFQMVFPQESPLVHNLSAAILELTFGAEGRQIEAKWLGTATPLPSYGIPNTDVTPITLRNFSGLFIITVCMSALMLLISIAKSVHAKYTKVSDSDMQSADGDGGSEGHGGSGPLQNSMGDGSMAEQPNHEARNEDPPGVNGIGESPGDVEPNGSLPEHAILIEMNTR
ncbi:glutamate receptor 2.5-like isoform X2 [Hordeum vulgare subsp. vulgare]|uniref:glutamate receptor 2.5-like isoform X2 n=1 Tax=Hordeum vulgare subsp. vulgare TaxID=112509 RepID=UPI001D1A3BAD|nr:glutamate receptor 2.5-like isoform X2 [Hordeum vulgare subsp. vulgare]